jgi:hypothetical protein
VLEAAAKALVVGIRILKALLNYLSSGRLTK